MFKLLRSLCATVCLCTISLVSNAVDNSKTVVIGTGGVTGVYFPAGGALCRLVNQRRKDHTLRCLVESTNGSTQNILMLQSGDLDLGIAQEDRIYELVQQQKAPLYPDKQSPAQLKALMGMHSELLTFVVRADSEIDRLMDIKGRIVNLGPLGSGHRGTVEGLFKEMGWELDDFEQVTTIPAADQPRALCAKKIDVMVYMVGHPNGAIQEATTLCDAKFLSVSGARVMDYVEEHASEQLVVGNISGDLYRGNADSVKTIGVRSLLLASDRVSDAEAYEITKSVFERLEVLKVLHPALRGLDKKAMASPTDAVPLHPGAQKYYREVGLL